MISRRGWKEHFGRYTLVRPLGQGGMGEVWKAIDAESGEPVAIKLMRGPLARNSEARIRFVREARAAGQIRHPNIVAVHDIGQTKGALYIVMEYVAGMPLSEFIGREGLSLQCKLSIIAQSADALGHAHSCGVVHRDVKPANIIVLDDRSIKMVDFGIAGVASLPNTLVDGGGTPPFMSPEQIAKENIDGRSDIWSLGVTLFELVTGVLPFRSCREILSAATPAMGPRLPISDALNGVLQRALAKDPHLRYQKAEHLSADLRRVEQLCADLPAAAEAAIGAGGLVLLLGPLSSPTLTMIRSQPASACAPRDVAAATVELPRQGRTYSLPDLKFSLPATGELTVAADRRLWRERKLRLHSWIGDVMTDPDVGKNILGLVALVAFAAFLGWKALHSETLADDPLVRPVEVISLIAICSIIGCLVIWGAYEIFLFIKGLLEHLPICKACGLRMKMTARWSRFCSTREEVVFGQHDCIAALRHGLWEDAAKLLFIYGDESLEGKRAGIPWLLPPAMYCITFFECTVCGHHSARLTAEDLIEGKWLEQSRFKEAYWGRTSKVPFSPLRRISCFLKAVATVWSYNIQCRNARRFAE